MAGNKSLQISGFDNRQIYDQEETITYRGTTLERAIIFCFLKPRFLFLTCVIFSLMAVLAVSGNAFMSFILYILHYVLCSKSASERSNTTLPARLPPQMKKFIPEKKHKDLGDIYVGVEDKTYRQIWKKSGDFLYHTLIIAGSGSGKTSLILSIFYINALSLTTGLWMKDFKGTVRLIGEMVSIATLFSRTDCLRIVNYNNPQKIGSTLKNSCTLNLHTTDRSYDSFSNLNVYMDQGSSDQPFFKDNAIKIINTLLPVLHDLQKNNYLRIKPSTIRKYLVLENFVGLYHDERIDREIIEQYLVPTYEALSLKYKDKENEQTEDNSRLYSNFTNNIDPALTFLIYEFPQIHESITAEFNARDLVLNRRIGVTINPTASLSTSHVESLAKTTLNQVKFGLGVGLGSDFHGSKDQVMYSARTSDDVPYFFCADEFFVGLKAGGLGLVAAQGRGCGIAAIYSTQDLVAAEETNKLEMGQIIGSTENKFLMVTRELERTRSVFEPLIPKIKVPVKKLTESMSKNVLTDKNTEIQEVPAFNIEDLGHKSKMPQGSFIFTGEGHVTRGKSFYYDTSDFEAATYRTITQLPTIPINKTRLRSSINNFQWSNLLANNLDQACSNQTVSIKKSPDNINLVGFMAGKVSLARLLLGNQKYQQSKEIEKSEPSSKIDSQNQNTKSSLKENSNAENSLNDLPKINTSGISTQLVGRTNKDIISNFVKISVEKEALQANRQTSKTESPIDDNEMDFDDSVVFGKLSNSDESVALNDTDSKESLISTTATNSESSIDNEALDDSSLKNSQPENNTYVHQSIDDSLFEMESDDDDPQVTQNSMKSDASTINNSDASVDSHNELSQVDNIDKSTRIITNDAEMIAGLLGVKSVHNANAMFSSLGIEGFDDILPDGNNGELDDLLIGDKELLAVKNKDE